MIIYSCTKEEFMRNCRTHTILDSLEESYREKIGKVGFSERKSWDDSLREMFMLLSDNDIPNDSGVAIEFKIPNTSYRIDFMISGYDSSKNPVVIIIELKGWQEAQGILDKDGIMEKVVTYLGGKPIETTHPSYQAWSYSRLLIDFNEDVQTKNINILPCAYLYRFEKQFESEIKSNHYEYYIKKAPIYLKEDSMKLSDYIKSLIKSGDNNKNLLYLENGKLNPSKSLQDSLSQMLKGNPEFTMIDNQKVILENALHLGYKSYFDNKKRVMIVEGGPGTGKSVVAINLISSFIKKKIVARYISKNSAPRNVYLKKLVGTKNYEVNPKILFTGSGSFVNAKPNDHPVLIVDEAHRLNQKSGMFKNLGENQIKEIINASKFSIFFIDENQRIHIDDIGSLNEIKKYAKELGAEVYDNFKLESQFRCSGSDGYLAWLDDVLDIRKTANFDGFDFDYEFKIFDDPEEMRKEIVHKNSLNNKSRLLAGYCWNWVTKGKNLTDFYDIQIGDFKMSWNLSNTSTWAIDKGSINEIGCIHTSQGLEFDYAGVIIGDDLRYENGEIVTDPSKRAKTDTSLRGLKKLDPIKASKISDEIIKNTYRTLMTRGMKGCYIYCTDKGLSDYLKEKIGYMSKIKEYSTETNRSTAFTEDHKDYDKVYKK